MILPETETTAAVSIAERIRMEIGNAEIMEVGHVTVSIGVASCNDVPTAVDTVLKQADEALYQAKQSGRNRVECLQPSA